MIIQHYRHIISTFIMNYRWGLWVKRYHLSFTRFVSEALWGYNRLTLDFMFPHITHVVVSLCQMTVSLQITVALVKWEWRQYFSQGLYTWSVERAVRHVKLSYVLWTKGAKGVMQAQEGEPTHTPVQLQVKQGYWFTPSLMLRKMLYKLYWQRKQPYGWLGKTAMLIEVGFSLKRGHRVQD